MGYIHQSVTTWRAAGAEGAVLFMILPMVEAYRAKGRISEGLSLIAERRERLSETGECSSDAEL